MDDVDFNALSWLDRDDAAKWLPLVTAQKVFAEAFQAQWEKYWSAVVATEELIRRPITEEEERAAMSAAFKFAFCDGAREALGLYQ